jgi:hypothetical protein
LEVDPGLQLQKNSRPRTSSEVRAILPLVRPRGLSQGREKEEGERGRLGCGTDTQLKGSAVRLHFMRWLAPQHEQDARLHCGELFQL